MATYRTGVRITSAGVLTEAWLVPAVIVGLGAALGIGRGLDVRHLGTDPLTNTTILVLTVIAVVVGVRGTDLREKQACEYRALIRFRLQNLTGLPLPVDVYERLWSTGECTVTADGFGDFVLRADESDGRAILFTAPGQYHPKRSLECAS